MSLQPASILAYSYVLGVASLLSPCGFALLPAYASYWMGSKTSPEYALRGGTISTLGFISTFLVLGLLAATVTTLFLQYILWIEVLAAGLVTTLGIIILLNLRMPTLLETPKIVWRRDSLGMYGFGVTYGLAASGCSAPLFLSAVALALGAGPFLGPGVLLLYGIGMGSAFIITAVIVAQGREKTIKRIQRATPVLHKISGILLILAGLYTLWIDLHGSIL